MHIPPSTALLHALSRTDPASGGLARPPKPVSNEAARAAARAVFAQVHAKPAVGVEALQAQRQISAPAAPSAPTAPTAPSTAANRPLPRGSIVNILV